MLEKFREPASVMRVIGLMSGTSLDGIDAAYVETDGHGHLVTGPAVTVPYAAAFRARLKSCLGQNRPSPDLLATEAEMTEMHAAAVQALCADAGIGAVDMVGFHGHTVFHDPKAGRTWQIGDGARLAARLGLPVVADFRSADVAAGGEGAPLAPIYHRALARGLDKPLALLNVGGVANVTWIGSAESDLLAFDTGPGNALLDDWVALHTGAAIDEDGKLAAAGTADMAFVSRFLEDPYFALPAPKSLDRDHFRHFLPQGATLTDGAATLVECTAAAVERAARLLPAPPRRWLVTGGGRHNPVLMAALRRRLDSVVEPVDAEGWAGDAIEAQAFAYLAVRSVKSLPLSFPGTTSVPGPQTGGRLFLP